MNKIDKFLKSLNRKDFNRAEEIIKRVSLGNLVGIKIKKLKKYKNRYRVKIGRVRLVFLKTNSGFVLRFAGYRDDKTYKKLNS